MRSCSAEPLWICQCIPSVRSSKTCNRYMPTLRAPVTGSRVKTMGRVMKRPASPGQHWSTGRVARLGCSVSITSWQGAERARRGPALATSKRSPSLRSLSRKEPGMRRSRSLATRAPRSSSRSTPRAAAIRAGEPKALMRTGVSKPSTCSKRRARFASAEPLETRSVISAISRSRETRAGTRVSCPCLSRCATKARRSSKATALLVIPDLHEPARDRGKGQAGDDPHDEPVLGAQDGQRGILPVGQSGGDDGQSNQNKGGKVEREAPQHGGIIQLY